MKIRILSIAVLIAVASLVTSRAFAVDRYVEAFNRAVSVSGPNAGAYDALYQGYNDYMVKLSNGSYSEKQQAVAGLSEMFPLMQEAALFFTGKNNNSKALKFAEAYMDISLAEGMPAGSVIKDPNYPMMAYFAASNNYNARNYAKAIDYLKAYISTGDSKNDRSAFNYIGKAYINLNKPEEAIQILRAGLDVFPDDLAMLTTTINLLGESKADDAFLQKCVTSALRQKPGEEGLIKIQGELYERTGNYERAITYFDKLRSRHPNAINVVRHLALNYYNAGVNRINTEGAKSQAGRSFLEKAAQLLNDVLANDPLSINYAYALANTYSILGDKGHLNEINGKIMSLGQTPVSDKIKPEFIAMNNDRVLPTQPSNAAKALENIGKTPGDSYAYTTPGQTQNTVRQTPADKEPAKPKTAHNHGSKLSDVDIDIPRSGKHNNSTFAVIIANSDYQKVSKVENAENDGHIFEEYCHNVLGIPKSNIRSHYNVTYGDFLDAIEDIKTITSLKKDQINVIFFYAGHGIPNEQTKTGYILPVDADGKQLRVCYPLKELYSELGSMGAKNTVVFLDACFSGSTRNSDMLIAARGVEIDVDEDDIDGKVVVVSAASGSQTALSYDEQNHGMFTYFLLKKLKDSKGDVSLGNLVDYLQENVAFESQVRNRKQQTPNVIVGSGYSGESWKNLILNK